MTESSRPDVASGQRPAASGDPRIDSLLNEGLDHYFAGRFEHAIHLWTRVLFLERHHGSAHAYIERARGALAERQRRADESLQTVGRLLEEGRAREARTVLTEAVASVGEDERSAALRLRLERLERVTGGGARIHAVPVSTPAWWKTAWHWANYRVRARAAVAVAVVLALAIAATSEGVRARLGWGAPAGAPVATATTVGVPVLSVGEVALARAQALYSRGRLAEALGALDRVGPEQTERSEADRLRVEIQRVLLASADDQARQGAR